MKGWIRLGIVLSVLWVFVGFFWGMSGKTRAEDFRDLCHRSLRIESWPEGCDAAFLRNSPAAMRERQEYAIVLAILPIPFAWLIAWGCVATGRWVYRGFSE
jgi:hypothetical protein